MAKTRALFVCSNCGAQFLRWSGRCADCGEWNGIVAMSDAPRVDQGSMPSPLPMGQVVVSDEFVFPTGIPELDRVLGSGLVEGSVVLLGGEPGIGKSTLCMQLCANMAQQGWPTMIITGEESLGQIRHRADRLHAVHPSLTVLAETNIVTICEVIRAHRPTVVVIDSVQVMVDPDLPSVAGSVNQVRHGVSLLVQTLKAVGTTGILVGHVTKDGALAGPKVVEHLVDVILYFDGESTMQYRMIRSFKNRYSGTNELGLFEMNESGLVSISNPSGLFLDRTTMGHPGSMVSAALEGSRVFLIEIQSIVVDTGYPIGKRTILGVDPNRAHLLIAVAEKLLGLKLSAKDIILNVVGGYKTAEPAIDLAVMMAMVSSANNWGLHCNMGIIGEVGLTGEVRGVPQIERRLIDCQQLGFDCCMVPARDYKDLVSDMTLIPVQTVFEAMSAIQRML